MKYEGVKFYGESGKDVATVEDGVTIGAGTGIGQNTYIGKDVEIGRNCKIMQHVTICKDAIIGDNVFVGPNSSFYNDKFPPTRVSQPPIIEEGAIVCGGCPNWSWSHCS